MCQCAWDPQRKRKFYYNLAQWHKAPQSHPVIQPTTVSVEAHIHSHRQRKDEQIILRSKASTLSISPVTSYKKKNRNRKEKQKEKNIRLKAEALRRHLWRFIYQNNGLPAGILTSQACHLTKEQVFFIRLILRVRGEVCSKGDESKKLKSFMMWIFCEMHGLQHVQRSYIIPTISLRFVLAFYCRPVSYYKVQIMFWPTDNVEATHVQKKKWKH